MYRGGWTLPEDWELPGFARDLRLWFFRVHQSRRPFPPNVSRMLTAVGSVAVINALVREGQRTAEVIESFRSGITAMFDLALGRGPDATG